MAAAPHRTTPHISRHNYGGHLVGCMALVAPWHEHMAKVHFLRHNLPKVWRGNNHNSFGAALVVARQY
jgi:hypothetical protein